MLRNALSVLGIGIVVVFIGLVGLIGIIYLMSFIVRLVRREESPRKHKRRAPEPAMEGGASPAISGVNAPHPLSLAGANRRETVAAVSAAIAETLGKDVSAIRIYSIKRVGAENTSGAERRELIAVISAAIAEELGTDVSGIRILSIKKQA